MKDNFCLCGYGTLIKSGEAAEVATLKQTKIEKNRRDFTRGLSGANMNKLNHPRLKAFLYLLLRDHLTVGKLEHLMELTTKGVNLQSHYSNKTLEAYTELIMERLLDE